MPWAIMIGLVISGVIGWRIDVWERTRRARLSVLERDAEDAEMAAW
jgi:hypothetical protein